MKSINVLSYSLKQGAKNLRQNGLFTLASIGTIAACLFLFGIFYFIVSNFQYMIKNAESSVGVTVFFEENLPEESIIEIGDQIRLREEVAEVIYISADEAWENFKAEMFGESEELWQSFGDDNPLEDSASYEVYLNDVSKQQNLVEYIKSLYGVRLVNSSDEAAIGFSNINKLVGYVSAAIIIILLAVSVFLINTTISMGIEVRKKEIGIMKLIGATNVFVGMPYIIEGIIIGFAGALIPLIILYFMYSKIITFISEKFDILADILVFLESNDIFRVLTPVSLILGIGIGLLGSLFTVRKHLKV